MVINLYLELNVRFNLRLNSEALSEEQKWMYHSQVSKLIIMYLFLTSLPEKWCLHELCGLSHSFTKRTDEWMLSSPIGQAVIFWVLWFKSSSIQHKIFEVTHGISHWRGRSEDCSTWWMKWCWGSGFLQTREEKAKGRGYNYLWTRGRDQSSKRSTLKG